MHWSSSLCSRRSFGVVSTATSAAKPQTVRVRPHQTLWEIAERYYDGDPREAVWRIERANNLRSPLLVPGQQLRLP